MISHIDANKNCNRKAIKFEKNIIYKIIFFFQRILRLLVEVNNKILKKMRDLIFTIKSQLII